jgi:hypothetical protein
VRVLPHCALQGEGERPWGKGQSQRILAKFQSNRKLTKKQLQIRSSQRFVEQATVSPSPSPSQHACNHYHTQHTQGHVLACTCIHTRRVG